MSTDFSILAIIISIVSVIITIRLYRDNKRTSIYQVNLDLRHESEKLFLDSDEPLFDKLLSLHGIDPKKFKEDDKISREEFYYILTSLRAAEAYYIMRNKRGKKLTEYREKFLKNKKVRHVYEEYLKDKLIANPVFLKMVDSFYEKQ